MLDLSSRRDTNTLAFDIMQQVTVPMLQDKDTAAVALGRKDGLKGGKARAEKLSESERKSIAKKGAEARWKVQG